MSRRKNHRGSEWRKWDLHIHAPGTKLHDQFKTDDGSDVWDAYCQKLHDSDVQAFGIADYFSIDCYEAVCKEYRNRYQNSSKVFFPNIELRMIYKVNKNHEEVHIHLLFNPFRPDHKEKIKRFLSILKTNKTNDSDLNITASELQNKKCYESATTTREFVQKALLETYGKNADLFDYVFIITAINNNGIFPDNKPRNISIAYELDKFSDAFFGNAGNVEWFLKTDRAGDKREPTKPKPVLSCCDAHSLADLDNKLGQVVTWIKADLTWEGLKQIIFEPENRVFIGEEPDIERRVREHKTRYIESLHITCVDGYKQQHGAWFHDEKIVFGKELVAIIGNKGSGKSAVTDIIGLLGNSRNQTCKCQSSQKPEELFSFLNKNKFLKGDLAKNFQGTLNWHGGEPDCKLLNEKIAEYLPEKIEYLPQRYLERVCTNIEDNEFRATLNEVVFRYVEKQDRYGKTNLDDLIRYLSQQAEKDIELKKDELRQANITVVSFEKKLTEEYRKKVEEKIKLKKEEVETHEKNKPEEKPNPVAAAPPTGTAEITEVEQLTRKINAFEKEILQLEPEQVAVNQTVVQVRQVKQAIKRAADALSDLETQHEAVLATVGLNFNQLVKITVEYSTLDNIITQNELRLQQIDKLLLAEDDQAATEEAKTVSLICQKAKLEAKKAEAIERLGKPQREYQQYLNELKNWEARNQELLGEEQSPGAETLRGLEKELENIDSLYQKNLRAACSERERISKDLFSRKRGLTEFYNTVKESIDKEIRANA